MNKLLLTTLCTVAIASTSSFAMAEQKPVPAEALKSEAIKKERVHNPEERKQRMEERQQKFDERLNLTAEQKAQAEKDRQATRVKMEPLMKEIKAKKEALRDIKTSGKSEEEIQKLAAPIKKDLKELKTKANKMREENMKNFEAMLTPAQKEELGKMKAEGQARRAEHAAKYGKGERKGDYKGEHKKNSK